MQVSRSQPARSSNLSYPPRGRRASEARNAKRDHRSDTAERCRKFVDLFVKPHELFATSIFKLDKLRVSHEKNSFYLTVHSFCIKNRSASRVGFRASPTCPPGQGGSRKGMRPIGNEAGPRER